MTVNFGHAWYRQNTLIDASRLIVFVRNPFARAVSMFYFHRLNRKYKSFEEFIRKVGGDESICNFIKNNDRMNTYCEFDFLINGNGTNVCFSWKNQCAWLPDQPVQFVGKLEYLQQDLNRLCTHVLHVAPTKCDMWLKQSTGGKDYRDEYKSEVSIAIVRELYKSDLDRFGYEFGVDGGILPTSGTSISI